MSEHDRLAIDSIMVVPNLFHLLKHVIVFVQPGVEDAIYLVRPPVDGNLPPKDAKEGKRRWIAG